MELNPEICLKKWDTCKHSCIKTDKCLSEKKLIDVEFFQYEVKAGKRITKTICMNFESKYILC
jgi:hypothetical protein